MGSFLPSVATGNLHPSVATDIPLPSVMLSKEIVPRKDFSGHQVGVSGPNVLELNHSHLKEIHIKMVQLDNQEEEIATTG